jgi:hypothetical protein
LPADLTWVKVNGGHSYGRLSNWDEDAPPRVGQHVWAADGDSGHLEAVITGVRDDGVITLSFPAFATFRAPAS